MALSLTSCIIWAEHFYLLSLNFLIREVAEILVPICGRLQKWPHSPLLSEHFPWQYHFAASPIPLNLGWPCDLRWPKECGKSAGASSKPQPQGALYAFICSLGTLPSCWVKKLGLSCRMERDTELVIPIT